MGVGRSTTLELLIKLREAGHLRPRSAVMEIGAQQLSNDFLIHQEKIMQFRSVFGIGGRLRRGLMVSACLGVKLTSALGRELPFLSGAVLVAFDRGIPGIVFGIH